MKKFLLVLILGIFLCASTAYALPTVPWDIGEINLASDNSAEYLINTDGNLSNTDPYLDVGDRLRGLYKIGSVGASGSETSIGDTWEFTGVFDIEVISKTNENTDTSGNKVYDYTFGTTDSFEAIYGTGAITAMYLDDTLLDYQRASDTQTAEELIDTATNTDRYWTFGFTGAGGAAQGGEGWKALAAPEDVTLFTDLSTGDTLGAGAFLGLNLLDNPLGPPLAPISQDNRLHPTGDGSPVHLTGSGSLQGAGGNAPFDLWDEFEFNVQPVPEPTTLLLFGTGLLGLAAFGRKKFMRKR